MQSIDYSKKANLDVYHVYSVYVVNYFTHYTPCKKRFTQHAHTMLCLLVLTSSSSIQFFVTVYTARLLDPAAATSGLMPVSPFRTCIDCQKAFCKTYVSDQQVQGVLPI